MSYDLVLQPRSNDRTRPPVIAVTRVVVDAGALAVGDGTTRFRLPDSNGEVDVDVVTSPQGVTRVEISSSSDSTVGLYKFSAAVAAALGWDVFDPQGGHVLDVTELRDADEPTDDGDDSPGIGPKTLLTGYLFLPVLFVWLVKGASPRSVLFPFVVALGLFALLGMTWDRCSTRGVSRRRRTRG